jgi:DNA-directed RNA polymerase specialized sigma24 family protein
MSDEAGELLTRLVREMGERLLAVARRVTADVPSAEDAVQEAYLELHRALGRRPEDILYWGQVLICKLGT